MICGQSCCIPLPIVPVSQGHRDKKIETALEQGRGGACGGYLERIQNIPECHSLSCLG